MPVKPFKGQDFESLKKSSTDSGTLFEDPEFPAVDSSLFFTPGKAGAVEWKRPSEICDDPKLFVDGSSSGDVSQGRLGNCWLVAATSVLATKKKILKEIVPSGQEWEEKNPYAGIFHFHFWQFGEWIDVVIDDRLPTVDGQLIFIHSKERNEFWSALLEKAYAKVHSCYEVLDGGNLAEALVDFTGGVAEPIDLVEDNYVEREEEREELFQKLKEAHSREALLAAAISAKSAEEMEAKLDNGLVQGHAYGITAVKRISTGGDSGLFGLFGGGEKLDMIRLRNPWGQKEWNGSFSDGDERWNKISDSEKAKLDLSFEDNGEFWMSFDDFVSAFTDVAVCRVVNTSFLSFERNFFEYCFSASWTRPDLAGGCPNNRDTFLKNPQFAFSCVENDENGELVLISLQQRDRRANRKSGEEGNLSMGFSIMKVEKNRRSIVHQIGKTVAASTYVNSRSVFLRRRFPAGRYVVVPCTFDPGHEGDFLLRIYTDKRSSAMALIEHHPSKAWHQFCGPDYNSAVRVKVVSAMGLEKEDASGGADPYCAVKCEKGVVGGEKVETEVVKDNLNPGFGEEFIFYRRFPSRPITVQVWNSNLLKDSYMGKAVFPCPVTDDTRVYTADLEGRWREKGLPKPGKVTVEVTSVSDLFLL